MLICDETIRPGPCAGPHDDDVAVGPVEEQTRQLALGALQETQAIEWLQMAEQVGGIGLWRICLPEFAIAWSAQVYRILRLDPDFYSPAADTVNGFYHPDDREKAEAALHAAASAGTPFDLALRLMPRDGQTRHVRLGGQAQAGPDGKPSLICGVIADITQQVRAEQALREANERLEKLAHVDVLTGLANRRRFDETLEREWRRAMREHTTLSLVLLDMDRLKLYNETYGYPAGDACLRRVAAVVARIGRRPADLAARCGGGEMALILPSTHAAGAEKVAREVCAAIAAMGLPHEGNTGCGAVVTASLGVVTVQPAEGRNAMCWTDMFGEAQRMLLEAKRSGRNRVMTPAGLSAETVPQAAQEEQRLAVLAALEAAGATRRTLEMDRIARLAATMTGAPIALVSLVGRDTQNFAGNYGLTGVDGTPRDVSFCAHTIQGDEPMVIADATRDPRFKDNELVTGAMGIRYYAGAPIVSPSTGHKLGALCVIDRQAHLHTSPADRALLTDLANMAAALIEEAARG